MRSLKKSTYTPFSVLFSFLFLLSFVLQTSSASDREKLVGITFGPTPSFCGSTAVKFLPSSLPAELERNNVLSSSIRDIVGPDVHLIKERQFGDITFMNEEYSRFNLLSDKAEGQLYPKTGKKYKKRLKESPGKYGAHYDEKRGVTVVKTFGDPYFVNSIDLVVYKSARPSGSPLHKVPFKYDEESKTWVAEIEGDLEGLWYQFAVKSQEQMRSQYWEPIPENFVTYDLTALKTSRHKTAQFYYPPRPEDRPKPPPFKKNAVLYELNLADVRPPDVPKRYWGTAQAVIKSKSMQKFLQQFDGVEIMPPRNAVMFENIGNQTVYLHHWAYMGTDFGFSERVGGVEDIIELVDHFHRNNKMIYVDHVYQHSANDMKEWQWMVKKPYCDNDITGCGNTLDLAQGNIPHDVTLQVFRRDLFTIGFDGSRQDLFGAVDRETAKKLRDIAREGNKGISGEPYGYGGGWARWNNPILGANLWDDEARLGLRQCANGGCSIDHLKSFITGGHSMWKKSSEDATVILETHDGRTAAEELGGDYHKIAQANAMLMSSQGPILVGPGQPIAFRHADLNDTPVNIFTDEKDKLYFNTFFNGLLEVRKKFSSFFNWKWIDEASSGNEVHYLTPYDGNALGIHFKDVPEGMPEVDGELIILHNMDDHGVKFKIPATEWTAVVDTKKIKATLDGVRPSAQEEEYWVPPHTTIWLWAKKRTK